MAKKKGSGNAPFYVAVRRCLSNPFTPPVYIEGRNGRCLCPKLTDGLYCEEHEALHRGDRASSSKRGYNRQWQKARARYLKAHPLCVQCLKEGHAVTATVVDHIRPHRGDPVLFWDEKNWQSLCKPCHDKKTWNEDNNPEYRF